MAVHIHVPSGASAGAPVTALVTGLVERPAKDAVIVEVDGRARGHVAEWNGWVLKVRVRTRVTDRFVDVTVVGETNRDTRTIVLGLPVPAD